MEQTVKIAVVQHRSKRADIEANTECALRFIEEGKRNGADFVLFPECFLTGYYAPQVCRELKPVDEIENHPEFVRWCDAAITEDSAYLQQICRAAKEADIGVGITAFTKGEKYPQNTAFIIDRDGSVILKYSKVHTCDFDWERYLEGGQGFGVCRFDGICMGVMICYDREYPESARELMLQGAELILVPNDCEAMYPRLQELSVHAMQNMCFVVMANPPGQDGGNSCAYHPIVWDDDGKPADNTLMTAENDFDGMVCAVLDIQAAREYRASEFLGKNRKPEAYRHLLQDDWQTKKKEKETGGNRQANYELLRILAMMMVITLHYLSKGGLLKSFSEAFAAQDYFIWLAEAFCTAAVNVYVLISGYFLVEAGFRGGKVFRLWAQVFFYSVGVPAVCLAAGLVRVSDVTPDRGITWILPVLREHYWFATVYLLLYVMSPLLAIAVKGMEKRRLRTVIGILLAVCSISKTVLPVNLALDTGGYDLLWFICLYLIAAYLRLYGIPVRIAGWRGAFGYAAGAAAIYALSMGYRMFYLKTGLLGGFYTSPFQYNHLLCLLAAVCLFGAFSTVRIKKERIAQIICMTASCTFGIYLLHENEVIRSVWPGWFGFNGEPSGLGLAAGWLAAVLVWFAVGIAAEQIRQRLFGLLQIK